MRSFWSFVSNGAYSVGCTGQTVYLYGKDGSELAKFKDLTYAYLPIISPDGKLFVVKSTGGRMAVYSLESRSLIRKFRFSKVDGGQDDSACFSPDGKLFINLERHIDDLHSAISVYDTSDFSLIKQNMLHERLMLDHIEYDKDTDAFYVLGFLRDYSKDRNQYFVAKLTDFEFTKIVPITENEFDFYRAYKHLEQKGFTQKAYEWSFDLVCPLEDLKSFNHTLAKLYHYRIQG